MKDSRHEKPACYYIFCYLNKIKQNLTCLNQDSCMQCCWFPKPLPQEDINSTAVHLQRFRRGILTNPILQSEFESDFFSWISLTLFENQMTCGYLQQPLADFRNIFCTILVAALRKVCEKRLLLNHKKDDCKLREGCKSKKFEWMQRFAKSLTFKWFAKFQRKKTSIAKFENCTCQQAWFCEHKCLKTKRKLSE